MSAYIRMTYAEARAILTAGTYGILATVDPENRPYGIPLSYAVTGNRIYFHGSPTGQKMKNLAHNPRTTFTVVAEAQPDSAHYTMTYRSVIAFGEARFVTDESEKRDALQRICQKYGAPQDPIHINTALARTAVFCMDVEYLSGKANG